MLTGRVASSCPLGAVSEYSLQRPTGREDFRGAAGSNSPVPLQACSGSVGGGVAGGGHKQREWSPEEKGGAGAALMRPLALQPAPLRAKRLGLLTASILPSFTTNDRSVQLG